jgi:hypothetical protein
MTIKNISKERGVSTKVDFSVPPNNNGFKFVDRQLLVKALYGNEALLPLCGGISSGDAFCWFLPAFRRAASRKATGAASSYSCQPETA